MNRMSATRLSGLLLALLLIPNPASADDPKVTNFNTSLSFSFADDNMLRDAGETRRNSPDAYFGQSEISPLDRVEPSQFRRTSSLLQLGAALNNDGPWLPEGMLLVRFSPDSGGNYDLADFGSFLRLNYMLMQDTKVALTFLPVDSDRFRLGRNYDISWGGSNTFPKNFRRGMVPGMKLEFNSPFVDAFAGMKTALIRSPSETILDNPGGNTNQLVERAYYAFLGGLAVRPFDGLRIDLQGAYFDKGTNSRASVLGKRIYSGGGTAAVSYNTGGKVGQRLDLRLYNADPTRFPTMQPGLYKGDFGLEVAAEYTRLVQTLEDPNRPRSTVNEWAQAGAFSAAVRFDTIRAHLNLTYRDLTYIVYNVPGFVPYQALPENTDVTPEYFGVVSLDYFFRPLGLTPAVSFGVLKPATYKANVQGSTYEGPYASEVAKGIQKVVVRGSNSGDWDILPAGTDEGLVYVAKFDLKWTVADAFALIGEVTYAYDPNSAQVLLNSKGHAIRSFDNPDILGVGFVSELKF